MPCESANLMIFNPEKFYYCASSNSFKKQHIYDKTFSYFKLHYPDGSLKETEIFVAASKLADISGVKKFEILKDIGY